LKPEKRWTYNPYKRTFVNRDGEDCPARAIKVLDEMALGTVGKEAADKALREARGQT